MANYQALAAYLENLGILHLQMSFAEVEAITGKLPPSAKRLRQFWENDPEKAQAREGWLAAGYETTNVSPKQQRLDFVRPPRRSAARR